MKILDEKGKLFGKINLIDLLAILLIIAALVFAVVRFTKPQTPPPASAGTQITYTARVNSITPDVYNEVLRQMDAAGGKDQLMSNGEMVNAWITKVDAIPHVTYVFDDDNNLHVVEDPAGEPTSRMDLIFTIEAVVPDPTTNQVGSQEVRVGKAHIIKTVHFEFANGLITSCN